MGVKLYYLHFLFLPCYENVADKKDIRFWNSFFFKPGLQLVFPLYQKNQLYRIRLCDRSFCSSMRTQEKLKCNMCSKLNIFTIMSLANTYITFPSVSHHVWIHSSYINITHVYFWLFWLSQGLLWVFWQKKIFFREGSFLYDVISKMAAINLEKLEAILKIWGQIHSINKTCIRSQTGACLISEKETQDSVLPKQTWVWSPRCLLTSESNMLWRISLDMK